MNWNKATKIIGVDNLPISELNLKIIKKKYHKLSLLYHPDKNNNTKESKEMFQLINEAYTYLNEIYYYEQEETFDDTPCSFDDNHFFKDKDNLFSFSHLLKIFIQSIFDKTLSDAVYNIVNDILNNYKNISMTLFDGLEKENCLLIYTFIMKYKKFLHLDKENIDKIREIILKKYDNVSCYKLNPKINDLFDNNIYKLVINDETYIVPLWHNELYFSSNDNEEYIVLCNPLLSDNISIDENNNIVIEYDISLCKISEKVKNNLNIEIELYDNYKISIEISKLFIREKQKYVLFGSGISVIKDDIYDIEEKSNIIININIDME